MRFIILLLQSDYLDFLWTEFINKITTIEIDVFIFYLRLFFNYLNICS